MGVTGLEVVGKTAEKTAVAARGDALPDARPDPDIADVAELWRRLTPAQRSALIEVARAMAR